MKPVYLYLIALIAGIGMIVPMLTQSNQGKQDTKPGASAPIINGTLTNGKTFDLHKTAKESPVLVVFISTSCPVTNESAPHFENILKAYKSSKMSFVGVVNSNKSSAERWASNQKATIPMIPDAEKKIIRAYGITNAPSAALIGKEGKVIKIWKGYSRVILEEINSEIAKALGTKTVALDFSKAPRNLQAG